MMFGGIFSSGGSMAGMSWTHIDGGLAHANQWPPLMLPLATYREKKADTIPEKWKNLAKYARKRRTRKKWQNKIRREIRKQQRGEKEMEGTATISLEALDELREKVKEAEKAKRRSERFTNQLMNCYEFDAEEYNKALKEIDNMRDLTDRQCMKMVREAMVKHLKIVVNPEELKKLIQEYIDEETSDEHMDIKKASLKELEQIQVVLKE